MAVIEAIRPPDASSTAKVEPDVPQSDGGKPGRSYSLRINHHPGCVCALCPAHTGEGPVGYFGEEPICDRCLDAAEPDLSALLALNAIVRIYVRLSQRDPDHAQSLLRPLLAEFGQATEHWGPPRLIWDPLNVPPSG